MEISANLVKSLREATGAGMMDCKKALVAAEGDMQAATRWLEEQALVTATKKASRIAAEGTIGKALSENQKHGVLIEINSETDFVARSDEFITFSQHVAALALDQNPESVDTLLQLNYPQENKTVAQKGQELITKIGENIVVRRLISMQSTDQIGLYVHNGRIGVLVEIKGANPQLAKEIAMQIAAHSPLAISEDLLAQDTLSRQKETIREQLAKSGKPANVIEQLLQEELKKFLADVILLNQTFIMDPSKTIKQRLAEANAQVIRYERIELGEGIEKVQTDFASEVMAQIRKDS